MARGVPWVWPRCGLSMAPGITRVAGSMAQGRLEGSCCTRLMYGQQGRLGGKLSRSARGWLLHTPYDPEGRLSR